MGASERSLIQIALTGTRNVVAGLQETRASLDQLTGAEARQGVTAKLASERTWLHNQALFTLRRYAYAGTLALTAMIGVMAKWGYDFNTTMQSARVALIKVFPSAEALNQELSYLFNFTKYTPFQFKDMTIAFRQMYLGFRPFGISVQTTNGILKALVDNLSATGRTTPGALNRVSIAMQHLANLGHLTGQAVLQLARDGIQIMPALRKELGLTADQMHNIGKMNIPVQQVIAAIVKYTETTPGLMDASRRQAELTLHGMLTTLKDNISQTAAAIEQGTFHSTTGLVRHINKMFDNITALTQKQKGRISIGQVFGVIGTTFPGLAPILSWIKLAIDYVHLLFVTIKTQLAPALTLAFMALMPAYLVLKLLDAILLPLIGHTQILGIIVGFLLARYILLRTLLIAVAIAGRIEAAVTAAQAMKQLLLWAWTNRVTAAEVAQGFVTRDLTALQKMQLLVVGRLSVAYVILNRMWQVLTVGYVRGAAGQFVAMTRMEKGLLALRMAYIEAGGGAAGFAAAAQLAIDSVPVIGWIIALIGVLIILYWRWKWFHNEVNDFFHFIVGNAPFVAAALTLAFGPLGAAVGSILLLIKYWDRLKSFKSFFGIGPNYVTDRSKVPDWARKQFHEKGVPGFAYGGIQQHTGLALVGERGPEIITLPAGARVTPTSDRSSGMNLSNMFKVYVYPQDINLDGQKIATVMANVVTDKEARA